MLWLLAGLALAQEEEQLDVADIVPTDDFDVPFRQSDFMAGEVQVGATLAFNGFRAGPFSFLSAWVGWDELAFDIEVGLKHLKKSQLTISLGFAGWYAYPAILTAASQNVSDTEDHSYRWSMQDMGGAFRVGVHYTGLASVDPYAFGAVGASAFNIRARVADEEEFAPQTHWTAAMRFEIGAGVNGRLGDSNWVLGGEFRYIISASFDPISDFTWLTLSDEYRFVLQSMHGPPKGFSWVFRVGYRIPPKKKNKNR